jgi:hypothetical protein
MARELSLTEQAFKLLKSYEEEELQDYRQLAVAAYRASAVAEETTAEMDEVVRFNPKPGPGQSDMKAVRKGQADTIKSLRKQHSKEKEAGGPSHRMAPDANYLLRTSYRSAGAHKLAAKHPPELDRGVDTKRSEPASKSVETHHEPAHKSMAQAAHRASATAHDHGATADSDRRQTAAKVARDSHRKAHDAHVAAAQALTKAGHYSTGQTHIEMARKHAEKANEYHKKAAEYGHEAGIAAMKAKSAAGGGHYSKGSWVSEQKRLMGYNEYPTLEESVTLAELDEFESEIRSWRWKQRDLMGIENHYPSRRDAGLDEAYEPPSEEDNVGEGLGDMAKSFVGKGLQTYGKEASLLGKIPGVPGVAKTALKASGAVNKVAGSALQHSGDTAKPEDDEEAPIIHIHTQAPDRHPGPIGHDFHAPPGHDAPSEPAKKPGLIRRIAGGVKKELGRNVTNLGHAAVGYATGGAEGAVKNVVTHGKLPFGHETPDAFKKKAIDSMRPAESKDEAVKTKMRFLRRQKQMQDAMEAVDEAIRLSKLAKSDDPEHRNKIAQSAKTMMKLPGKYGQDAKAFYRRKKGEGVE